MKHKTLQKLFRYKLQWLVLLVALLGMSQGVWGKMQIKGTWDDALHDFSNDTYTVTLSANTQYKFYLYETTYSKFQMNNGIINSSNACNWLYDNKDNYEANMRTTLNTTSAGTYTFTICNWETSTNPWRPYLQVTYPGAYFTEGQLIWLDIQNDGDGWGKEPGEKMFIEFYTSSYGNVREMTKVAGNGDNSKKSVWVYRITSTDAGLNSTKLHFRRGTATNNLWNTSSVLDASDVASGNDGIYINSGWDNVGTKYNAVSNTSLGSITLDMQNSSGTGGQTSCLAGATVKFDVNTKPTITVNGTSKGSIETALYYFSYTGGSYSSGKQTSEPYSWTTTNSNIENNGTATAFVTFPVDVSNTPATTPASAVASYRSVDDATFTVNPSCTPPTKDQYNMASGQSVIYDGSAHAPTISVDDGAGRVTNIYGSTDSGSTWTDYGTTGPTNAGTYSIKVNVAAGDTYCAADEIVLDNTYAITKKTPAASDFDITNLAQTLPTTIVAVEVTPKSGISGMGSVSAIYYNGIETLPTAAGTYAVTFDVDDTGSNYTSASGLSAGDLVISKSTQSTITMGSISSKCGTGAYTLSCTGGSGEGAVTYATVVNGETTGTGTIDGNTLNVTTVGRIFVKAVKAEDDNYYAAESTAQSYDFVAPPVSGFSASAESSTLNFSNTAYVSTTLSTAANSNWDFKWVCDSHPTWGSNNTPTIVSTTSNSTEVRFPIEGVYTFHVGAKCKKDDSYVNSTTVTVTVSLPLWIKGPLTSSTGSWNSVTSLSNISNSNTRTYGFTAYNLGTNIREFVLDASASGDDKHHIHTASTVGSLSLTGLDYNSNNDYNLRALEALGISSFGTPVLLTITHNGGLSYNISLVLNCTTPDTKEISISESSVCQGESVNVVVESSQDGYIYTVYDSNSSVAGSGTGTGSDLNISVTPSAGTTYTVKAKQADACLETSMANTVDISVNERPSFTPSTGITQYAPVTVTSTALSPSWSIASKDPDVDAAWISTTSGSSTVLKAPTGTYTVSDGGPCPTNAIVVSNDTEICN
jgi:hypothetical protein